MRKKDAGCVTNSKHEMKHCEDPGAPRTPTLPSLHDRDSVASGIPARLS